jgi:hypothetical protein
MSDSWKSRLKAQRFSILLGVLGILLAGPPIVVGFGMSALWFDGVMSVLMLAAIVSLCFEPQQKFFALLLGIPSILFSMGGHLLPGALTDRTLFFGHLCVVLFLFGSAALIAKSLFSTRTISLDSIMGALCGYLFLGLGWAVAYSMIESLRPGSFEISRSIAPQLETARPLSDVLMYYSFVTLTTLGYGDVLAVTPATRTCSWIEATTGQFYLAVIVAGVVTLLVARNSTPSVGDERDPN